MYKIATLNKISDIGLELFGKNYAITNVLDESDGALLRSYSMHDLELPDTLQAIARAGAGVNNIPVDKCSEKGIVVFNTPGANANAVKELTIAALFIASRNIVDGIEWVKTLTNEGDEVPKLVEKGKSQFVGPEIAGKKLGVIGLGAIGVMVANSASYLGMDVEGFDPYISIDAAWDICQSVKRANNIESIWENSDYITLHVPLTPDTKHMLSYEQFALMKKGTSILNFSRGELVNIDALKKAIAEGIVTNYVTDFANEELLKMDKVIVIPHLGASTPESEENCAKMSVKQLKNFLENGNITNSVNFPSCELIRSSDCRITIAHKNVPNMVAQISSILSEINIVNMINKSKGNFAYTIIDVECNITEETINKTKNIPGVLRVRMI